MSIGTTISNAARTAATTVRNVGSTFKAGYYGKSFDYPLSRGNTRIYSAGQVTRTLVNRVSTFFTNTIIPQAKSIGNRLYKLWNTVWTAVKAQVPKIIQSGKRIMSNVIKWIKQTGRKAATVGRNVYNKVKTGASNAYSKASNWAGRIDERYKNREATIRQNRADRVIEKSHGLYYTDNEGVKRYSYNNRPVKNKDLAYSKARELNKKNQTIQQKWADRIATNYERTHSVPTTDWRGREFRNEKQRQAAQEQYAKKVERHTARVMTGTKAAVVGASAYGIYTGLKHAFQGDQED